MSRKSIDEVCGHQKKVRLRKLLDVERDEVNDDSQYDDHHNNLDDNNIEANFRDIPPVEL